jgi:hypothetical protein
MNYFTEADALHMLDIAIERYGGRSGFCVRFSVRVEDVNRAQHGYAGKGSVRRRFSDKLLHALGLERAEVFVAVSKNNEVVRQFVREASDVVE